MTRYSVLRASAVVMFLACASPSDPAPVAVDLTLDGPHTASVGEVAVFESDVLGEDGEVIEGMSVAWQVSDSSVAEPLGSGRFSARQEGVVTVTALGGGLTASTELTITAD